jgi:hypothetical protein
MTTMIRTSFSIVRLATVTEEPKWKLTVFGEEMVRKRICEERENKHETCGTAKDDFVFEAWSQPSRHPKRSLVRWFTGRAHVMMMP